jgi:hypothetical protein
MTENFIYILPIIIIVSAAIGWRLGKFLADRVYKPRVRRNKNV